MGVPLLCGVSGYLEHPETQGSAWTPKFRGSPLLWGALGPQHPKTWGGGLRVPPNSGGAPFNSVSWSRVRPKTWGSHAHPEIRGPPPLWGAQVPRVPQNSGVALISGVPSSHLYPKIRGSPPIWGALGPSVPQNWGGSRVHPKTQGPPLCCSLAALGSCAPQKSGGPECTPKLGGPPRLWGVLGSRAPQIWGSHLHPEAGGSPSFLRSPQSAAHPKTPLRGGLQW